MLPKLARSNLLGRLLLLLCLLHPLPSLPILSNRFAPNGRLVHSRPNLLVLPPLVSASKHHQRLPRFKPLVVGSLKLGLQRRFVDRNVGLQRGVGERDQGRRLSSRGGVQRLEFGCEGWGGDRGHPSCGCRSGRLLQVRAAQDQVRCFPPFASPFDSLSFACPLVSLSFQQRPDSLSFPLLSPGGPKLAEEETKTLR